MIPIIIIITIAAIFILPTIEFVYSTWFKVDGGGAQTPACCYYPDNAQFSLFRPARIISNHWHQMLFFAYFDTSSSGSGEKDCLTEVVKQAEKILAEDFTGYVKLTQDSSSAIPHESEITVIANGEKLEFNPSQRSFQWLEDIHKEEFRFRSINANNGDTLRGSIRIFLGSIQIADIFFGIKVFNSGTENDNFQPVESSKANHYRKIFASYSHKDVSVLKQIEQHALALGDKYLRDINHLRSGEVWSERIKEMIEEADIFQLFWSTNSMRSSFVKKEYEYALSLGKPNFVRPTYWQIPLPESPEERLPPEELKNLHFQRISGLTPEDQNITQEAGVRVPRSGKQKVGKATAIVIPILISLSPILSLSTRKYRHFSLDPTIELNYAQHLLPIIEFLPCVAASFCILVMILISLVRNTTIPLIRKLISKNRKFWLKATVYLTFLSGITHLIRLFSIPNEDKLWYLYWYASPEWLLLSVLPMWITYTWIRWVFLPSTKS